MTYTLHHGDCLDLLRTLPSESAQAVITDPPYGANIKSKWDQEGAALDWVGHLDRVCAPNATVVSFASLPYAFALNAAMELHGWRRVWDAVWTKKNGGFKAHSHLPRYQHELIIAYARDQIRRADLIFNGYDAGEAGTPYAKSNRSGGLGRTTHVYAIGELEHKSGRADGRRWMTTVLSGNNKPTMRKADRTAHPTQKPLEVVSRLVRAVSRPGDLVLDPFAGSGTTGHACLLTGRRFVGIEREQTYIDIARARLEAAQS